MNRRHRRHRGKIAPSAAPQRDISTRLFERALALHQQGRVADAAPLYRALLTGAPNHVDGLHLLGLIAMGAGHAAAAGLIARACALNPAFAVYYANLGVALRQAGRRDEAMRAYRSALALAPDHAETWFNCGNLALESGAPGAAIDAFRRALRIKPAYDDARYNYGNALMAAWRHEEAISVFEGVARHAAVYPDARLSLGNALQNCGRLGEAIDCFTALLTLQRDSAKALGNRGNALYCQGDFQASLDDLTAALCLQPDLALTYAGRGSPHQQIGKIGAALRDFDRALRIAPDLAETHSNRGNLLCDIGAIDEACAAYREALRINPDFVEAHSNYIFALHYASSITEQTMLAETRAFGARFPPVARKFPNPPVPSRRLRVGFVSGDLHQHSVATFLAPFLSHCDRGAFEIFCYATRMIEDAMATRLRAMTEGWRSLAGKSDRDALAMIQADAIDILVDLSGHTAFNRLPLFALRPAPVQFTWLGYPDLTGVEAIDYRLVDAITDPEPAPSGSGPDRAGERLLRLKGGFLCFEPPPEAPDIAATAGLGGSVTFGSFNNPAKLSEATLASWARLLQQVPEATLLLKGKAFGDPAVQQYFQQRFRGLGGDPSRLSLVGRIAGKAGHLEAYHKVDIALDPFPYNGTTTSCEALWMGVPVVALRGDRHSARVSASLLTRLGHCELIGETIEDYIAIARKLAGDSARRRFYRESLRPGMAASSLCDGRSFANELGAVLRESWRQWCERPS